MTDIKRTAYPRLKDWISSKELESLYTLTEKDHQFISKNASGDQQRFNLAVLLKSRLALGYFIQVSEIPDQIMKHLESQLNIWPSTILRKSVKDRTRMRYLLVIREYIGSKPYDSKYIDPIIEKACYTMSDPADLINVALQEMTREKVDFPAFSALDRLVGYLRSQVHDKLYSKITQHLTVEGKEMLDGMLQVKSDDSLSDFTRLKQSPHVPTLKNIRKWTNRMNQLNKIIDPKPLLKEITHTKVRQFASEARAYPLCDIRDIKEPKRHAILLCLLDQAQSSTLDQLIEMFLRRMNRTHRKAKEELKLIQEEHQKIEESLINTFGMVLEEARNKKSDETLGLKVRGILKKQGGIDKLKNLHERVSAYHQDNYLPLLWNIHVRSRSTLYQILELLPIESATQDNKLIQVIDFLKKHRQSKRKIFPSKVLNIDFFSQRWLDLIQSKEKGKIVLDRRSLEVCAFTHLALALGNGDVYVVGSQEYADYREQLLSWEECKPKIKDYCEALGLPENGEKLVATLQSQLYEKSKEVDSSFHENSQLTIDSKGKAHLKKQKARPLPEGFKELEELIHSKMKEHHLLDILKDINHWTDYTRHFCPPSGSDPKISDAVEKYLFTIFGYGCNLGPSQTARHAPSIIDQRLLSRINAQHINANKLEASLNDVISEYARFELPKFWGTGRAAIADGTHIQLRKNNLIGEQHIRYGKYGGIAYHHISDTYIALFSNFISCGVWEAVYILDGLLSNKSEIQPDILHADTQGQSEVVFGVAFLLAIFLMPRMRTWNDVILYRPSKDTKYNHIDELFSGTIDWSLIETHWPDMMQVVLSIQAGKVLPSMLLRKLGTYSNKNKLYKAFRELGRVVRTLFLLDYASDPELRQYVQSQTVKVESYNDFLDWVTFGGPVMKSGDPLEQEKNLKYTNLVANSIMLHNVTSLTKVINEIVDDGREVSEESISRLSPYIRQHIQRFGQYTINMEQKPSPLKPEPINVLRKEGGFMYKEKGRPS